MAFIVFNILTVVLVRLFRNDKQALSLSFWGFF
jgi:hypothetical protein